MIAAYQRISRADGDLGKDGKDKSNSIENQKELIQRYISHKESLQNLPVMDFVDDGYTGSNFDRPGFQKMMDGVRSGEIDTIIVKDLSRFGRDYIGVGEYMEQIFPLLGVRLISINDNYDSSNYNGTTLGMDLVVSNLVNTMYCRDAGKKLRTANRVKWRKGISTASAAPFGYQFDPNRKGSYIIDPPAAKIVRRIFDLAILGLGTREIAMALNDENAPVPSVYNREHKAYGKETTYTIAPVILWDSSRVWKILTAYVYTGAMVLGKSQRLISGKKIIRIVPKGQQYITEGTHEAIVSREEFEKAQLVIRNNGHRVVMGSVDFPLKGKIRCGNCRRVLGYDYKQASPIFWCREGMELIGQTQCSSEIYQASDIENAVFQALKKELSLLDSLYSDIKKEEQSLKEASRKASRRKTLMEQELKNLKGEKMRMYEEYATGTLSLDNYKSKKLECDRKIAEVQDKIEQFKAEESVQSVVPGTVRAAAEQAENFLHGTRLTASMVSAFIENVYVHEGWRIVVRFKYEQSIQDAVRALHTD
jgi:site-specific DNA recombinase